MSAISDNQVNFNPTWMQSPPRGDRPGLHRMSADSDDCKDMIAPVFAEHRYGREDILALQPQGTRPPDGLLNCPFVVMDGQGPIILMAPTEAEQRLSTNINSSKALSLVNHQERINGGGASNGSHWVTAGGSGRGSKQPGSRWSALTNNDSPTGGLHYVKPGLGRGVATSGRGGGIAGFTTGRGGHRGGFEHKTVAGGDRTRSRLKSSSEEEGPGGWTVVGGKQDAGNVWKNSNGRNEGDENGYNRLRGNGSGQVKHGIGRFPSNSDRFYPDFKRSESHEPTENWLAEERKAPERQLSSPPIAVGNFGQYSPPIKQVQPTTINDDNPKPEEAMMNLQLDNPDNDSYHSFINTLASATPEFESWYYLDPENKQHGPYEAPQMLIWYKSKFFSDELRCCRTNDGGFTTLGQLIKINGSHDPFQSVRKVSQPPPSQQQMMSNTWQSAEMLETQRAIMEERRRLAEEQDRIRRDEAERIEKEHRLRLMEEEIERRKEELHRVARAKEEEFERKRFELMEMERQRQEADRLLAEQREREAAESRRIQEERERERQRLEAQQRAAEDLIRREKEKAEQEAARLREQAIMEARRLAAEEAEKQKLILLQEQRNEQVRLERVKQLMEATKKREAEEAAANSTAAREAFRAAEAKGAPWVAKEKLPQLQTQRSLLEIQLEEEKKLQEQRKREQESVEQQKKQQKTAAAAIGPWANSSSSTKGPWNSSVVASKNAVVRDTAWPTIPPATVSAASIKKETVKPQNVKEQPVKNAKVQEKKKAKENGSDEFKKWALTSITQLNKTVGGNVEAEPFVAFIQGIENPDEVEDYFLSYFGESTSVKEFHRLFLEKRIELRPRTKIVAKDDLSAAQAAVAVTQTPNLLTAQPAGKKKKPKAAKTIDLTTLGFKPAGNPNRINAGEIDVPAPISPPRKKR